MNVFSSFSLCVPAHTHCVHLALWTHKDLCGSFYVPCINFHSFIHSLCPPVVHGAVFTVAVSVNERVFTVQCLKRRRVGMWPGGVHHYGCTSALITPTATKPAWSVLLWTTVIGKLPPFGPVRHPLFFGMMTPPPPPHQSPGLTPTWRACNCKTPRLWCDQKLRSLTWCPITLQPAWSVQQ